MNEQIRKNIESAFSCDAITCLARCFGESNYRVSMAINFCVSETLVEICSRIQSDSRQEIIDFIGSHEQCHWQLESQEQVEKAERAGREMLASFCTNRMTHCQEISELGRTSLEVAQRIQAICTAVVVGACARGEVAENLEEDLCLFSRAFLSLVQRNDLMGCYYLNLKHDPAFVYGAKPPTAEQKRTVAKAKVQNLLSMLTTPTTGTV